MPTFRIKELARERGFTADALARHSSVKFGTVRNIWQNRIQEPTYSTLKALAKTLHVSIEELEACEDHVHDPETTTRREISLQTTHHPPTSVSTAQKRDR